MFTSAPAAENPAVLWMSGVRDGAPRATFMSLPLPRINPPTVNNEPAVRATGPRGPTSPGPAKGPVPVTGPPLTVVRPVAPIGELTVSVPGPDFTIWPAPVIVPPKVAFPV